MQSLIFVAVMVFLIFLIRKQRLMSSRITNLTQQVNSLAQESASTHWVAHQNKESLLIIQEALNAKDVV